MATQLNPTIFDTISAATTEEAEAGKDIQLFVFDATGTALYAVAAQRGFKLNRSAEEIDTTNKDTPGGYGSSIAGMKKWGYDIDGLYIQDDAALLALEAAFLASEKVAVVRVNTKTNTAIDGGLCSIIDFPIDAPYNAASTYSLKLSGAGQLNALGVPMETEV